MRYLAVIVALIFVGLAGCSRDATLSPAAFTRLYSAELQKVVPLSRIRISGEMELRVTDVAGKEQVVFLNNCYDEYRANPAGQAAVIARYVAAFRSPEIYKDEIDPARIVPIVKDRAWMAEVRKGVQGRVTGPMSEHVFEPLNEQLTIVYAEDSPKNIRYLSPDMLVAAKIPRETLRALAIANLRRIVPKIEVQGGNGVFMIIAGGDFEACLLLFDDLWQGRQMDVRGDYVVAIPSRDMLLVTGSQHPEGIQKVREVAAKTAAQASYRLTPELFVYRGGRFVKFEGR
jgi:uncharacterized protein YtpQ (UPF0354 family)